MTTTQAAPAARPKFDNHGQYSRTSILRYEMIFGAGYISTGGARTTDDLCARLGSSLRPGVRVLDVGSGIGGAAFHLAKTYGAKVTGIDLAEEMVAIAHERARAARHERLGQVHPGRRPRREVRRAVRHHLEPRRVHAHPGQGPLVFAALRPLGSRRPAGDHRLRPGKDARLARVREIHRNDRLQRRRARGSTASCSRPPGSPTSSSTTPPPRFVEILKSETGRLVDNPTEFLASFSEADLKYLVDRWEMKVGFCKTGDMKWGNYLATRKADRRSGFSLTLGSAQQSAAATKG